jgi:hypothetical protein
MNSASFRSIEASSGILILAVIIVDVVVTTLTLGGGGPLTSRLSAGAWWVALQFHRLFNSRRLLGIAGWSLLIAIALLWFVGTWMGWVLIFNSAGTAVVTATNKLPATFWETVYFTGYTLSTLGLGDYQPNGTVWMVATAIASMSGFFLVTLTFAYLLPVISAATQQRQLALYISSLGGTPDEIVARAWTGKDFGEFSQHLIALSPMLIQQGENHLTYPILHYFHSIDRDAAIALSITCLDEALTLLDYGVAPDARPDPSALQSCRRANSVFLKTLKSAFITPAEEIPVHPPLDLLRRHGIPTVSDRAFCESMKQDSIVQRRRLLLALAQNDGWSWNAVASSQTTNRAQRLE